MPPIITKVIIVSSGLKFLRRFGAELTLSPWPKFVIRSRRGASRDYVATVLYQDGLYLPIANAVERKNNPNACIQIVTYTIFPVLSPRLVIYDEVFFNRLIKVVVGVNWHHYEPFFFIAMKIFRIRSDYH